MMDEDMEEDFEEEEEGDEEMEEEEVAFGIEDEEQKESKDNTALD